MGDVVMHSKSSVQLYGGVIDDYVPIHEFLDLTKMHVGDNRHRAILHNTFGIHLVEKYVFGPYIINASGKEVSTRTIASQHVMEDLGAIPTLKDCIMNLPIANWMTRGFNKNGKRRLQTGTDDQANTTYRELISWLKYPEKEPPKSYPSNEKYLVLTSTGEFYTARYSSGNWLREDSEQNLEMIGHVVWWAFQPIGPGSV